MNLTELISDAAKRYPDQYKKRANEKPTKDNELRNLFEETIPSLIRDEIDLKNIDKYEIKGSVGQGGFAQIPWIAVMNKTITETTQKGIYLVYLFNSDGSKIYLSLNQGTDWLRKNKNKSEINRITDSIRKKFPYVHNDVLYDIQLNADTTTGKSYETSNVYSLVYDTNKMPSEQKFMNDLNEMIMEYESIVDYYSEQGNGDIKNFYKSFETITVSDKFTEFKYLLKRFVEQANINITGKENKGTTIGSTGFENNSFHKVKTYDVLIIDGQEYHVHLFSSGNYGPKTGKGSSVVPYFCYYLGNKTWVNVRTTFENYRVKRLRIVTWNETTKKKKIGTETGLSYEIDSLDLFSDKEPNDQLKRFVDDFLSFKSYFKDEEEVKMKNEGWNKIFYGPPGTGKTYSISKEKKELIMNQGLPKENINYESLKWREAILFAFKEEGYQRFSVNEICDLDFIKQCAETINCRNTFQAILTTLLVNAEKNSSFFPSRNGFDYFKKDIDGKWSVTENGKAVLKELEKYVNDSKRSDEEYFFEMVTFHQSYGYEDFIEGIYADTEDGQISYRVKDGVFKKFCNKAKMHLDKKFLFVIDEINRGNISKIFGELITLIETTKRFGNAEAMSAVLPYSGESFSVPNNVYILGTMNTADRSLAMMDTALRRRFEFIEKMPDSNVLRKKVKPIEGIDVSEILDSLNQRIEYLYDREHTLGHAFFMNIETIEDLKVVFENKVIPLLQEYFFEDYEKIQAVLNDDQEIYIAIKEKNSTVFAKSFAQLVNDYDYSRYILNKGISIDKFKRFIENIIIHEGS